MAMECAVCENAGSRYKCPTCRISYCSLKCWRKHRDEQCVKTEQKPSKQEDSSRLEFYSFPTDDTISPEKLKLLGESAGVRKALYNPYVRDILNTIDKSRNPSTVLRDSMQEPIFVEFVEECMKVVEPSDPTVQIDSDSE